jgi:hypothetical protein
MNSHVQGLVAKAFAKFEVLQLNCSIITLQSRFVSKGEEMGSMLFMFGIKELDF